MLKVSPECVPTALFLTGLSILVALWIYTEFYKYRIGISGLSQILFADFFGGGNEIVPF